MYDFDNTTGVVSNPEVVLSGLTFPNDLTYGLAFSPTGNKLYVGWNGSLVSNYISGFDVSGGIGTIAATRIDHDISAEFVQNGMCRAMVLGPDGNIYIAWDGVANNTNLGVIANPEDIANPSINMNGYMISNTANLGLPNIAYYYHPFVDNGIHDLRCINESTHIDDGVIHGDLCGTSSHGA